MRSWLTALRIARREARRAKGRSALVATLIGLPVLALAYAAVSYDTFQLTPEQEIQRDLGAADAQVDWLADGPVTQTPDARAHSLDESQPRSQPPTRDELATLLPAQARAVPLVTGELEAHTATGIAPLQAEWLDLADPVHRGRVELTAGRAPEDAGEVALTSAAADRTGTGLGDELVSAGDDQRWTVVGIAEYPWRFQTRVLFPPEPADQQRAQRWLVTTAAAVSWDDVQELNQHGLITRSRAVLLDPPTPSEVDPRFVGTGAPDQAPVLGVGTLIVGLALLEVVLLAGPAFAVGARRRQRDLALLAANGATTAQQRRIVLADGVVLGLLGATAGITLGAAAAVGTIPLLEEHLLQRRAGGLGLFPLALAGIAALAVVTGLLAAVVPATVAARQPVVAGLAGRRGVVRSRKRWLVLGLTAVAAGTALATAGAMRIETGPVLAGLILLQAGLVLCTPALVGLVARAGRLLPLALRIALRDTARNRAAAAPAISAVMAAVAGALALGMYLQAAEQRSQASYQPGLPVGHAYVPLETGGPEEQQLPSPDEQAQIGDVLHRTLPTEQVWEVATPHCDPVDESGYCRVGVPVPEERRCPAELLAEQRAAERRGPVHDEPLLSAAEQREARQDPRCQEVALGWSVYLGHALVDDGTAVAALVGGDEADRVAAVDVLRSGGVVVTDPRKVVDGQAAVQINQFDQAGRSEPAELVTVPAHAVTTGVPAPFAVLSPELADRLGVEVRPRGLVAATTAVPSQAEQDALRAELTALQPELGRAFQIEHGQRASSEDPFLLVLAVVAGVVALAAAGIATGLAAADRRGDLSTLAAVGASPRVRRMLSLSHAGVVAGLGGLLGTLAGVGSGLAVLVGLNQAEAQVWPVLAPPYPVSLPWPAIGLLLVVVPAVAMLGAGLLTRSRLPIERRAG